MENIQKPATKTFYSRSYINPNLVSVFIFIQSIFYCNAQVSFQKAYGGIGYDYGASIKQTPDNGFIIAGVKDNVGYGSITDNCIFSTLYLLNVNANGNLLWNKTFNTSSSIHAPQSIDLTDNGGFIVAGRVGTECPFMGPNTSTYVFQADSSGNIQWSNKYSNPYSGTLNEESFDVRKTKDQGYIVTGERINIYGKIYDSDAYLMKLKPNGNIQWTAAYGDTTGDDVGYSVFQTNDGGYIMGGVTDLYLGYNENMYLVKTDSTGKMEWNRTFDISFRDHITSVKQTADGGYIVLGNSSGNQDDDLYLLKLYSNGSIQWAKFYGAAKQDYPGSLELTKDGGYIISGYTYSFNNSYRSDAFLLKTDSMGNILWSKTYGDSLNDYGYNAIPTNDNGYILIGGTTSFGTGGDIYLVKTDSIGNSNCNEIQGSFLQKSYTVTSSIKGRYTSLANNDVTAQPLYWTNGSGAIENQLCLTTDIKEYKAKIYLSIYPNPATDNITIELSEPLKQTTKLNLCLYDNLGKEVLCDVITNAKQQTINTSCLSKGFYLARLFDEKRNSLAAQKIVVQ